MAIILAFVSAVGVALLFTFPEVVRPPYNEVDPLMQRLWIDNIIETKSFVDVWSTSPLEAIAGVQSPIFLILALALLAMGGARKDLSILLARLVIAACIARWQIAASNSRFLISRLVSSRLRGKMARGRRRQPFAISLML